MSPFEFMVTKGATRPRIKNSLVLATMWYTRWVPIKFESALDQFQATGWTPVASAIQQAKEDLESEASGQTENLVYVVSDGKETCGGDPVKEAKKLNRSNIQAVVNIIGFDVNDEGQRQLKQAAQAGGVSYSTVNSKKALDEYFEKQREELSRKWSRWINDNVVNSVGESEKIEGEIFDILDQKLISMIIKENERLQEAVDYLESNKKVEDEMELSSMVFDRKEKLKKYLMDQEQKTTDKVQADWKKEVERMEKIEREKQREIEQDQ